MADNESDEKKDDESEYRIERWVGIAVVVLATFLGVCNVKDANIVQAMQKALVEKNDNWAWYQARNIRNDVYRSAADQLSVPYPGETPATTKAREAMAAKYLENANIQAEKMKQQREDAEESERKYMQLNSKDDQFDLSEAALAIALAMMGVTALIKRWWMFWIAMIPAAFGLFMGAAGFAGVDTNTPIIRSTIQVLS